MREREYDILALCSRDNQLQRGWLGMEWSSSPSYTQFQRTKL